MKKKLTFLILTLVLVVSIPSMAQLRIEDCYVKAKLNYPLIKQYDLIEKAKEYNVANANKGYLPQFMFSAKATYQSDVTKIPIDLSKLGMQGMAIPELDKDQYGASIELSQILWDGGAIKAQKKGLRAASDVDKRSVEVNIYAINERINQLYFGILLVDEQIDQNRLLQDELKRHYTQVSAYVDNGVANQSDLDAIRINELKAKQVEAEFLSMKSAYMEMLSLLIGEDIVAGVELIKPEVSRSISNEINRPELALYAAQIQNLKAQNSQITAGLMPKLGLFVTGGYGRPGLNMLDTDFSAYYRGGVKLSWNIGNFYTKKNSRRKIETSITSVEVQRETFLFNTHLDIIQKNNVINKYYEQLKYDDEIIALRNSVKRASEAKMANGTLSGTDLTRDINSEQMAIQDKILHEAQLLLAIYNLKFATNN